MTPALHIPSHEVQCSGCSAALMKSNFRLLTAISHACRLLVWDIFYHLRTNPYGSRCILRHLDLLLKSAAQTGWMTNATFSLSDVDVESTSCISYPLAVSQIHYILIIVSTYLFLYYGSDVRAKSMYLIILIVLPDPQHKSWLYRVHSVLTFMNCYNQRASLYSCNRSSADLLQSQRSLHNDEWKLHVFITRVFMIYNSSS